MTLFFLLSDIRPRLLVHRTRHINKPDLTIFNSCLPLIIHHTRVNQLLLFPGTGDWPSTDHQTREHGNLTWIVLMICVYYSKSWALCPKGETMNAGVFLFYVWFLFSPICHLNSNWPYRATSIPSLRHSIVEVFNHLLLMTRSRLLNHFTLGGELTSPCITTV